MKEPKAVCGVLTFKRLANFLCLIKKMVKEERIDCVTGYEVAQRMYKIATTYDNMFDEEIPIIKMYQKLYEQCYALRDTANKLLIEDTTESTLQWSKKQTEITGCIVAAKLLAVAFSNEVGTQAFILARRRARENKLVSPAPSVMRPEA